MTRAVSRHVSFDDFAADLDRAFEEVASGNEEILVEKQGKIYRLELVTQARPDIWANYDPEKVREALKRSAGALKGVDAEALKADIYAARGQHRRRQIPKF